MNNDWTEGGPPANDYPKLIINAAITGMVPKKKDTPHVPITPEEIIEDSLRCVSAGASILHLHARDEYEVPTYKAEVYGRIIEGIRRHCPEAVLCVTTSGRTYNEFEKRAEVLDLDGPLKPDMASLTMGSLNFLGQASVNSPGMIMRLAEKMAIKGIKPELEIFDPGMVNSVKYLYRKGYLKPPFYFNLILGSVYSSQGRLSDLVYLRSLLPPDAVWAGGGLGTFQLVVNSASILMGGHVRVGIEDNICYDRERKELTTNEKSILRLKRIASELGREIASPEEARRMLGLKAINPALEPPKTYPRPCVKNRDPQMQGSGDNTRGFFLSPGTRRPEPE
jgi:3-keto-5-aminohexanoate cleavage enzyme